MLRSITIDDVNDTTASGLIEEARRQGVSVERVAGQLLQRGRRIMILMRWRAHGAKTTLQPSCRASLTSSRWIIRYGREDVVLDTNAYMAFKRGTPDAVGRAHACPSAWG